MKSRATAQGHLLIGWSRTTSLADDLACTKSIAFTDAQDFGGWSTQKIADLSPDGRNRHLGCHSNRTCHAYAAALHAEPEPPALTGHLPRLGPDLLAQTMRSEPSLQGFEAYIVDLAVVLDGVALQRLGSIRMNVGHDMGRDFLQRPALDPGRRCRDGRCKNLSPLPSPSLLLWWRRRRFWRSQAPWQRKTQVACVPSD